MRQSLSKFRDFPAPAACACCSDMIDAAVSGFLLGLMRALKGGGGEHPALAFSVTSAVSCSVA